MSLTKQAIPVIAAALVSALLFGSVAMMTPESLEAATANSEGPTPYSADHARIKGNPDEERTSTF